jgi:O-antigen ligase
MGTGLGTTAKDNGAVNVEPGSSYLAVLSMTGLVGAISFAAVLGPLLLKFLVSRKNAGLDKDILCVVGIYLAIHANAEGWVLAIGTPTCFLFWLWLGNVGDFPLHPSSVGATPRTLSSRSAWLTLGRRKPLFAKPVQQRLNP